MKRKLKIFCLVFVVVLVALIATFVAYTNYMQKKDNEANLRYERHCTTIVMRFLRDDYNASMYKKSDYDIKYYNDFLGDVNLSVRLQYLSDYMGREYPDIGYGTEYEEVTIERLKKEPVSVYEEFMQLEEALNEYQTRLDNVMHAVSSEMIDNGDYVGLPDDPDEDLSEE